MGSTVRMDAERASGLLLHPTSLPGPHGSGDLGAAAARFADALSAAGQTWWQMLPVGPTGFGGSPYQALSTFAGNPLLVGLDPLASDGLLDAADLATEGALASTAAAVDFEAAWRFREPRLRRAAARFDALGARGRARLDAFRVENSAWLPDYALYCAIKAGRDGAAWYAWEPELRGRHHEALERARLSLCDEVRFHEIVQLFFAEQWATLRRHCAARGVALLGDLPIFVSHDSADVWARPDLFFLNEQGDTTVVAGVPPDYFSETGQRWGNPIYRWDVLASRGFDWWIARLRAAFERFDAVRLDHFIGFHRYWEIPADQPTAEGGHWVRGPGAPFFEAVRAALGPVRLVAEDLGSLTSEVEALRDRFELPGMKVLQFCFGTGPDDDALRPDRWPVRALGYTGTHDNDTARGWWSALVRAGEEAADQRALVLSHTRSDGRGIHWDAIRLVWESAAAIALAPLQDALGLGTEARMNTPGLERGNWTWRVEGEPLPEATVRRLRAFTERAKRLRNPPVTE